MIYQGHGPQSHWRNARSMRHYGGYDVIEAVIDRYLLTLTAKKHKSQEEERYFGKWWKQYFTGRRLNTVTVTALEEARLAVGHRGR